MSKQEREFNRTIKFRLRVLMVLQGLNVKCLAAKAQMPVHQVQHMVAPKGVMRMTWGRISQLAEAMGWSMAVVTGSNTRFSRTVARQLLAA